MTTRTSLNLTTPTTTVLTKATNDTLKATKINYPSKRAATPTTWQSMVAFGGTRMVVLIRATPGKISEKIEKSVKDAEEACAGNPVSGECAAAWDEVEELSAAASHALDRKKESSDPLENYCKDNPETDECRTYDN